MLTLWRCWYNL